VVNVYEDGLFISVEYLSALRRTADELKAEVLRVVTSILEQ